MKIKEYIQDLLVKRLANAECLVVYDPDGRYQPVAMALKSERCNVVDGSVGAIRSREEATAAWLQMGAAPSGSERLLVYLPIKKPLTDEDKQRDPFQAFVLGGDAFPRGDGDSYLSLCLQAKPGFEEQIYQLFTEGSEPSFRMVDALDRGSTWPQLRTLLSVESPREILVGLLCPTDSQKASLEANIKWLTEYQHFAQSTLGFEPRGKLVGWEDMRDELARFVLF